MRIIQSLLLSLLLTLSCDATQPLSEEFKEVTFTPSQAQLSVGKLIHVGEGDLNIFFKDKETLENSLSSHHHYIASKIVYHHDQSRDYPDLLPIYESATPDVPLIQLSSWVVTGPLKLKLEGKLTLPGNTALVVPRGSDLSALKIEGGNGWVYADKHEPNKRGYLASIINEFRIPDRTDDATYFVKEIKKENETVDIMDRTRLFQSHLAVIASGSVGLNMSLLIDSDKPIILVNPASLPIAEEQGEVTSYLGISQLSLISPIISSGIYSASPLIRFYYAVLKSEKGIILTGDLIRPDVRLTVQTPELWLVNFKKIIKEFSFDSTKPFETEAFQPENSEDFLNNLKTRMEPDLFKRFLKFLFEQKLVSDNYVKDQLFDSFKEEK